MDPETALRAPELPYLEAFHAVCTLGGFTAAARQLGCTQPTISYRIRRLEALLGARLLERDNRRVVLTPEGERLRALMGDMMAELARLRGAFAGGDVGAPLRIGAASGFGRYVLVPALHALRLSQPYPLEIRLQYDAADAILDGLD